MLCHFLLWLQKNEVFKSTYIHWFDGHSCSPFHTVWQLGIEKLSVDQNIHFVRKTFVLHFLFLVFTFCLCHTSQKGPGWNQHPATRAWPYNTIPFLSANLNSFKLSLLSIRWHQFKSGSFHFQHKLFHWNCSSIDTPSWPAHLFCIHSLSQPCVSPSLGCYFSMPSNNQHQKHVNNILIYFSSICIKLGLNPLKYMTNYFKIIVIQSTTCRELHLVVGSLKY